MALNILNWQITPNTCLKANMTLGKETSDGYLEILTARIGVEHKFDARDAIAEHRESLFGIIPYTVPFQPAIARGGINFYGARVGLVNNEREDIVGLDLGIAGTRAATVTGLQLGGLAAIADTVFGIGQFSGVYNETKERLTGIQLGLINWIQERWGLVGGLHIPQINLLAGLYFGQN